MRSVLITGLDVGSTRTRAVIGEYVRDYRRPEVRVLGIGSTPTVGVRKDVITDLDAATECIRGAVSEAEVMAGVRVDRAYVGIAGDHVAVERSSGVVAGSAMSAWRASGVHQGSCTTTVSGRRHARSSRLRSWW